MHSDVLNCCDVRGCCRSREVRPAHHKSQAVLRKDGWDEIDDRLVFLTVRLANVEASLEAIENAIAANTKKGTFKSTDARKADKANEKMDRHGGGPVSWSVFYGRTAEKFFYHPVDANTTYHTTTVLQQLPNTQDDKVGKGVPSSHSVPVHQRPPQFDYIYRANRDAKTRAEREAAEIGNKVDALLARRHSLEKEQSGLWCEIAFRAVAHYDLAKKPIYRFEPAAGPDTDARQHAEALKSAVVFVRAALGIVVAAQKDQAKAFGSIRRIVSDARERLDDDWLRHEELTEQLSTKRSAQENLRRWPSDSTM